jgi:hypothetical protein
LDLKLQERPPCRQSWRKTGGPLSSRAGLDRDGVITVVRNAISIDDLTLLFFVYALFDGLVGIAGAVRAGEAHNRWTILVLEG